MISADKYYSRGELLIGKMDRHYSFIHSLQQINPARIPLCDWKLISPERVGFDLPYATLF